MIRYPKMGIKNIIVSFFCGAFILIACSIIQKLSIGANLLNPKGYIVPLVFGGITGIIIRLYILKCKEYQDALQQRVNSLESILPICSHCKRIRKPDTDPKNQDSWEAIESYISQKIQTEFSHGICPECIKTFYPKQAHILDDKDEKQP